MEPKQQRDPLGSAATAEPNPEEEQRSQDIRGGARPASPNQAEKDMIERVAQPNNGDEVPDPISPEDQEDATAWLLSAIEGEDNEEELIDKLRINVGSSQRPKWIDWHIKALPGPVIRKIREQVINQRSVRKSSAGGGMAGLADASFQVNVRVLVEATVFPDVKSVASSKGIGDPGFVVERALNRKQGLIDQLAAEVMKLSGYEEDDVQDSLVVRAAGN